MEIPQEFHDRLEDVFGGRLRARWSKKTNSVHIEQKVGRMIRLDKYVTATDDLAIRQRDGYHYVLEVQPGDRMPCPSCRRTLKVTPFQFTALNCVCGHKMAAAYYPLSESLIDHLKRIDPLMGASKRVRFDVNQGNQRVLNSQYRELANIVEGAGKDEFNRMAQIQSTGWTTKTGRMWTKDK